MSERTFPLLNLPIRGGPPRPGNGERTDQTQQQQQNQPSQSTTSNLLSLAPTSLYGSDRFNNISGDLAWPEIREEMDQNPQHQNQDQGPLICNAPFTPNPRLPSFVPANQKYIFICQSPKENTFLLCACRHPPLDRYLAQAKEAVTREFGSIIKPVFPPHLLLPVAYLQPFASSSSLILNPFIQF